LFGYALKYWGLNWKKIPHRWGNTRALKWTLTERSLFRAGRGWMILGRGYGFLGSVGGGVMDNPQREKEGLLEINEHFIHLKEYGFIVLVSH